MLRLRLAHALAAGACALALVAAGCGGDDEPDSGGASTTSAPAETTATSGGGATASAEGKEVFAANCASCHTLADADANGSFGPNLDEVQPDAATVEAKVKNGGGGMPAFDGQLDDAEIAAVAAYVAESAGQ
ncbi:MAG: cytochrome c [Solirubrobacteraceae bacterium]|nr:cytochrome c [Solirubrobacteraceae bacterium]